MLGSDHSTTLYGERRGSLFVMLGTVTTTDKRTVLLNFRATPAEYDQVVRAARQRDESLSTLLRRAALEASARALAGTVTGGEG